MKTTKIGLDLKLEAKYPDSLKDLFVLQSIYLSFFLLKIFGDYVIARNSGYATWKQT